MFNRADLIEKVLELNERIELYQRMLKYTKDYETAISLHDDILRLMDQKALYLELM